MSSSNNSIIYKSTLENLLKCDICNTLFDSSIHIPMVVKCGHTFCKNCLLSEKCSLSCPLDKIKNMLDFETSIRNIKLEVLIQKAFNISSPESSHKIYTKPDIKKKVDQKYLNKLNNVDKTKNKLQKNTFIDEEKNIFDDSKINISLGNETIETIPLNDDKSTVTNSFQIEFADLLNSKNLESDNINTVSTRYNIKSININFNTRKTNNPNINNMEKESNNINSAYHKNSNSNNIKNTTPDKNLYENNENILKSNINNNNNSICSNNKNTNNKGNNKIYLLPMTTSKNTEKNKLDNYKTVEDDENEEEEKNMKNFLSSRQLIKLSKKFSIFDNEKEKEKEKEKENINKKNYINSDGNKKEEYTELSKNTISNFCGKKVIQSNSNLLSIKDAMNDENNYQKYNINKKPSKKFLSEKKLFNFFKPSCCKDNLNEDNISDNYISPTNKNRKSLFVATALKNHKNPQGILSVISSNDSSANELSNKENKKISRSNTTFFSHNPELKSFSGTNSNIKNTAKTQDEKNENCINQKEEGLTKKININKVMNKFTNTQNVHLKHKTESSKKLSPFHKYNYSLSSTSNFQTQNFNQKNQSLKNNHQRQNTITERNNRRAMTKIENQDEHLQSMISNIKIRVGQKIYDKRGSNDSNNLNLKKDIFTKLRKDFQFLFKNDNIVNKTKYEEIFESALQSFYISKIISQEKFIDINLFKVYFINDNNLFVGLFDSEKNSPKKGILHYSNGDHYEGEFANSKKEGEGKLIYKNGWIYEGSFKNDLHDGFGKIIESGGDLYEGEWKNGKIEGKGTRTHKNGDKYIGNYINNIRNGSGKYFFANGDCYEGTWENGKANGNGIFKYRNGEIYEGEFKDNLICGKGKLTKKNGDIYQGEFVNGLIQGKGSISKENGDKFNGYFVNGKKNGLGKLVDKNGKLLQIGNWKMDEFINNNSS